MWIARTGWLRLLCSFISFIFGIVHRSRIDESYTFDVLPVRTSNLNCLDKTFGFEFSKTSLEEASLRLLRVRETL